VKNQPKNGMIDAPRNSDSKHASEAPKTYARRAASIFHAVSRFQTTYGFRAALRSVVGETKIMRLHLRGLRRARSLRPPFKLHIGCGPNVKDGWINIDLSERADLQLDLREALPFPDGSATIIYSEHFFEHLSFQEGIRFLRDSLRVLVPGGLVSIGVPDAEFGLWVYLNDRERWQADAARYNNPKWCNTPMHGVNYLFRQEGEHKYAYDFETLAGTLKECGFLNIRRRNWDAALDLESRQDGTLYVDAEKPHKEAP
jgi:predicted SAM-dependent methyltransferase